MANRAPFADDEINGVIRNGALLYMVENKNGFHWGEKKNLLTGSYFTLV